MWKSSATGRYIQFSGRLPKEFDMNKKLKPCPFCGGDNIGTDYIATYSLDSSFYVFGCLDCDITFMTDSAKIDDYCLELWNKRVNKSEPEN